MGGSDGFGYRDGVCPSMDGGLAGLRERGQTVVEGPARQGELVHTAVRRDARDPGGAETTALWRGILRSL